MAQDTSSDSLSDRPQSLSRNLSLSRLNAKAPEFVPRSSTSSTYPTQQPSILYQQPSHRSGFFHAHRPYSHQAPVQYQQQQQQLHAVQAKKQGGGESDHVAKDGLTEEATQKILNQVEFYFSDVNLATTDHLISFINKDPGGYVPISVVSSFKKIKALLNSNSQLAGILRNSAKLAVSEDGKKVRRQLPLTKSDMEELQSRIIIAENLPEDHCHQNLMKIFSAVGSVKSIRTCQPQTSNGGSSSGSRATKADGMLYSSKLHAFVEYDSIELAEKAVVELNEEGNWRNGLRVRLMPKRTEKSAQARAKKVGHEGESHRKESESDRKEDDTSTLDQRDANEKHLQDPSQKCETQSHQAHELGGEQQAADDKEGAQKKGRSRGRGKGRGRPQYHNSHPGNHVGTQPSVNSEHRPAVVAKQPPGPRMPDGTRGFSMGRGKPAAVNMG